MLKALLAFVEPYYQEKDAMHNLTHIDRVYRSAKQLAALYPDKADMEVVTLGCYFHGMIKEAEREIRSYLVEQGFERERMGAILTAAEESHAHEVPFSFEGKILHDAHLIEGGKTFLIVKSLCTGAARGQTLEETMEIIESRILGKRTCYLPEAVKMYEEMEWFARSFLVELKLGMGG